MRTTLVCGQITAMMTACCTVGLAIQDSMSLIRERLALLQLSRDHTLPGKQARLQALTPAEGDQHILTKSLGGNQVFEPVCGSVQLSPNQIIATEYRWLDGIGCMAAAIEGVLSAHAWQP